MRDETIDRFSPQAARTINGAAPPSAALHPFLSREPQSIATPAPKKGRAAHLASVSFEEGSMTSAQHQPTIMDFFDFQSGNPDGSISMYKWTEDSKDRLYILNQHRKKLLQLVVKDEPSSNNVVSFAQIKIVPYGIDRAKVYRDQPDDPNVVHLNNDLELTYHGGPKGDQTPKIHMKVVSISKNRYRNLVDCSLSLNSDIPRLAPIGSLFSGYDSVMSG